MKVKRIVANIESASVDQAKSFYQDLLGLEVLMDLDWIRTYGSEIMMPVQISIANQGSSGTVVPDLSVEVDNIEQALEKVKKAGMEIEYGPVHEAWGVRRFYVRDPFGKLINILEHD